MNNTLLSEKMEKKGCEVLNLNPEQIFNFPEGIPGFEKIKEYCLLIQENEKPFAHLTALGGFNLEFVVVNPWIILPGYRPDISDEDFDSIGSPADSDVIVLVIVTLAEPVNNSTVNLCAPIIINAKNGKGKQVAIRNLKDYSSQQRIYTE